MDVIDGALFPDEVKARRVMAVPTVYLNGEPFMSGRHELGEIVAKLDEGFVKAQAERISAKKPFDVLVVSPGRSGPQGDQSCCRMSQSKAPSAATAPPPRAITTCL